MSHYDVAVIGAGPVGCVTALAFAHKGASVLLLEANPRACERLAGEWLHPPAVEILRAVGADDCTTAAYDHGHGFAVFPDDSGDPILLPYRDETRGISIEHSVLVNRLREHCRNNDRIVFLAPARATAIAHQKLTFQRKGEEPEAITAELIVGAAGRSSLVHDALGLDNTPSTYSRMAGLLLRDCTLPHEGYGHVFLGGPGPVLTYRIDDDQVRMCMDVPLSMPVSRNKEAVLWESFKTVIPQQLHAPFKDALHRGDISWAANQTRPRTTYGREGLVVIGDAAGHHHPLTALGMTLGFQDAVALVESNSFKSFRRQRVRDSRVPEMLAVALYEVFADPSDEVVAIRHAVYDMWRQDVGERSRTMAYLACQDTKPRHFGRSFVKAAAVAARRMSKRALSTGQWGYTFDVTRELVHRCRWLISGALRLSEAKPYEGGTTAENMYGDALGVSAPKAEVLEHPAAARRAERRASASAVPHIALERAVRHLKSQQQADGSWEGECIWCPMLPAQYVLMCHITGTKISEQRRRLILEQFATTQLADGNWGLHELSPPYLFVTTLVYVAARMLGVASDDPLLDRARLFIQSEGGAVMIPSWGKFWLALVGLYDWSGVNPVLPEIWRLPRWLPMHPGNYYCHTRLIYLGMASLYGRDVAGGSSELRSALRDELYPAGYANVSWDEARHQLREDEIFTPPSAPLRFMYDALRLFDRTLTNETMRGAIRTRLVEHIRFEFKSTDYTCISPVNGMLNMIVLWLESPDDPDFHKALERFEGWIWEDETDGMRIAGARSATWDTSLAVQAMTAASPHFDVTRSIERADAFLETQQITKPQADDYDRYYRLDPTGGYCFAGVWHGWPVSDCTAEAMIARIDGPAAQATEEAMTEAARFVLRTKCPQGGFGSYEPFRPAIELEWLNPAEMFGDSMTEHPYVECSASCISALAAYRQRFGDELGESLDEAIDQAALLVRNLQRPDGSWSGNWGIHFIYGTMFGIRGLLNAGVAKNDPVIRKACRWLKARQRPDGGWGESHESCLRDEYVSCHSQVIQTAWALTALLEADDPDWDAIERAVHYLAARQNEDGSWPKEEPTGVFFHTALLHYELYRSYFPLWSLGLYETRRLARLGMVRRRTPARPARVEASNRI
jgi:lanosterol synthase